MIRHVRLIAVLLGAVSLGACTTAWPPAPIDESAAAAPPAPAVHAAKLVQVAELPRVAPLRSKAKQIPPVKRAAAEPADPHLRIEEANRAARVQPTRADYMNAIQVYPFAEGALYQLYAAPGEISDIALQPGEKLVGSGPVAAGDTVRWIIGETESGSGPSTRVHILLKPTQPDLVTNLVINTDHRTYHLELRSNEKTYMASVSWTYPSDPAVAPRPPDGTPAAATPVASEVDLNALHFRYRIEGDNPPWRPLGVFDNGRQAFIEFPRSTGQGEMPPLWLIGPSGGREPVHYRVEGNHMIVDRLFTTAELRLAGDYPQVVRIVCTDPKPQS